MEKRDLGVQSDYVERAFKRDELPAGSASIESKRFFFTRSEQMTDLEHIQANRPLGRPGTPGWRCVMSPLVARQLEDRRRAAEIRAQQA